MNKYFHPFHIVQPSPWPLFMSASLLVFTLSLTACFQNYQFSFSGLFLGTLCISLSFFFWFRDIIKEASFLGFHTLLVQIGIKLGFYLFVISEIFVFFFSILGFLLCKFKSQYRNWLCFSFDRYSCFWPLVGSFIEHSDFADFGSFFDVSSPLYRVRK